VLNRHYQCSQSVNTARVFEPVVLRGVELSHNATFIGNRFSGRVERSVGRVCQSAVCSITFERNDLQLRYLARRFVYLGKVRRSR